MGPNSNNKSKMSAGPVLENKKWKIENVDGNQELKVEVTEVGQSVYAYNVNNSVIQVSDKVTPSRLTSAMALGLCSRVLLPRLTWSTRRRSRSSLLRATAPSSRSTSPRASRSLSTSLPRPTRPSSLPTPRRSSLLSSVATTRILSSSPSPSSSSPPLRATVSTLPPSTTSACKDRQPGQK